MPRKAEDPAVRFSRYVDKSGECWIWTGCRSPTGYGTFGGSKTVRGLAHRFSYAQRHGDIPAGMCVLHKCDVPACVNPDHLWLGTQAENMADKIAKGRQRVGAKDRHRLSKVTREMAADFVRRRAGGEKVKDIAKTEGLCVQTVSDLLNGRHWTVRD